MTTEQELGEKLGPGRPKAASAMDIYRVHVSLLHIAPTIWRRIELSGATKLGQFHRILQIAMGWQNYHLHEYLVAGRRFGTPSVEYDAPGEVTRESRVRLATVLPHLDSEILYIYDFGDYWQHAVRLEAIVAAEPGVDYPRVVDGGRRCPPEDCGGSGGYAELLAILMDPDHEDFEHMRSWAGPEFYAEVYPIVAINQRLRKSRGLAPK